MIIKNNISLKNFTTIRIGGNSKKIYFPESIEDISNMKKILLSPKSNYWERFKYCIFR